MSTTTCPKCGKPLRPGARFCGNCGNVLAAPAQQPPAQPAAPTNGPICPYCGKPVRAGAKFCNSCGKTIVAEAAAPPSSAPASQSAAAAPAGPAAAGPAPAPQGAKAPPGGPKARPLPGRPAPVPPRPATPAASVKPARKGLRVAIIGVFLLLCVAAAVGGYFVYDRFLPEWFPEQFGKATDTQEVAATDTPRPTKTEKPVEATLTEESPIETPTEQILPPVETPIPTIETPVLPVVTVTPTVTATVTVSVTPEGVIVPPIIGQMVLENDFTFDPIDNWRTWGKNYPRPAPMPSDNPRLNLAAIDSGSAGATSRQDIAFVSGVELLFRAQLDPDGWQHPLIFDWDPVARGRGPENRYPGIIRLVISKDELVVQNGENLICRIESIGRDVHTYRIRVIGAGEAEIWLDDQVTPSCSMSNLDLKPSGGKISFTGMGWLLYVRVTVP